MDDDVLMDELESLMTSHERHEELFLSFRRVYLEELSRHSNSPQDALDKLVRCLEYFEKLKEIEEKMDKDEFDLLVESNFFTVSGTNKFGQKILWIRSGHGDKGIWNLEYESPKFWARLRAMLFGVSLHQNLHSYCSIFYLARHRLRGLPSDGNFDCVNVVAATRFSDCLYHSFTLGNLSCNTKVQGAFSTIGDSLQACPVIFMNENERSAFDVNVWFMPVLLEYFRALNPIDFRAQASSACLVRRGRSTIIMTRVTRGVTKESPETAFLSLQQKCLIQHRCALLKRSVGLPLLPMQMIR